MAEGVVGIGESTREPPQLVSGHLKGGGRAEPVAIALGIDYPFPPDLEYAYPPPDGNILTNIVGALIAVPRFYTQVLHLMNKMNLPPPFRPGLPTPPLPTPAAPAPKRRLGALSSGESELESSEEESETVATDFDNSNPEHVRKKQPAKKLLKREPILGPATDKGASHEAAGVKFVKNSSFQKRPVNVQKICKFL